MVRCVADRKSTPTPSERGRWRKEHKGTSRSCRDSRSPQTRLGFPRCLQPAGGAFGSEKVPGYPFTCAHGYELGRGRPAMDKMGGEHLVRGWWIFPPRPIPPARPSTSGVFTGWGSHLTHALCGQKYRVHRPRSSPTLLRGNGDRCFPPPPQPSYPTQLTASQSELHRLQRPTLPDRVSGLRVDYCVCYSPTLASIHHRSHSNVSPNEVVVFHGPAS